MNDRHPAVLLVEDDDAEATRIERYLTAGKLGPCDVLRAETVAQARTMLRETRVSLVLLDLTLPDGFGVELVDSMRMLVPDAAIVVLTETDDEYTAAEALRRGAQDYLVKHGLTTESLVRSVRHARERHLLSADLRIQRRLAQAARANFRNALGGCLGGLVVVDQRRRIRFANDAARQLLGNAVGGGKVLPGEIELSEQRREVELRGVGQRSRVVEVQASEISWDGRKARLVSLGDVTDRFDAERMRSRLSESERLAAVGQVAAGVAHEINNPSAYVLGNLGAIEELLDQAGKRLDQDATTAAEVDEARRIVSECVDGMQRIRTVVGELREFSRTDVERAELAQLREIVEGAARLVGNQVRQRGELIIECGPTDDRDALWVRVHRERLGQVFVNLMSNAAAALPRGAPEKHFVRVSAERKGPAIRVRVEDNGQCIGADELPHIFDPFFTTREREVVTGLGLSIARDIVTRHGGDILARARDDGGTLIEVSLPAANPPPRLADDAPRPTAETSGHVLLVDDEEMIRVCYARSLQSSFRVTAAKSGAEALATLERLAPPQAIVCDLAMPGMDGPEFYAAALDRYPALADRFLFLTGGAFTPRIENFIATTRARVLYKPLSRKELIEAVSAVAQPS